MREDSIGTNEQVLAFVSLRSILGTIGGFARDTRTPHAATMILLCLVACAGLVSIGTGSVSISPLQVVSILLSKFGIAPLAEFTHQQVAVLFSIRLPRILLGIVVGAGLSLAGAVLQGLFRNPLADPGLIGVSGGAAFSVAVFIVLGNALPFALPGNAFTYPVAAFVGGLLAVALIYRIGRRREGVHAMLLAGIAVGAFSAAGIGLMSFLADDSQLRNLMFWNLGSLGGATWGTLTVSGILVMFSAIFLIRRARVLNVLLLGESEARLLGINTSRLRFELVAAVALAVGASVAVAGPIAFVGLICPHLIRMTTGADHRQLLPNSALFGAGLVLTADLISRVAIAPAELPIGVLTALIGAPFFVWLLVRE
ncbi:MAG: iron ABC transporter permease [Pyrinomonadaceae bacterium]